jgi:hypothetical protein
VQLVASDAPARLKKAIGQARLLLATLLSPLLCEALGHARREQQPMLAALLRPLFTAESREAARTHR